MAKRHYIVPIFVPFLGCPHKCIFCDQEKITGCSSTEKIDVAGKINAYLATIQAKEGFKHIEVGFYGGSFTGLPLNYQKKLLEPARILKKQGVINSIRLSTRPDYIDQETIDFLLENGVTTIELGVQSLDQDVLTSSNRGHSIDDVVAAVQLIKKAGIHLGIQLMIGLPQDTPIKAIQSAKATVKLSPDFVRIYPVIVLKGTRLAEQYQDNLYQPWALEQAVEVSKKMVYIFTQSRIPIIRIGLQDSQVLKEEHFLAGPYHPAMGELVQGAIYYDMMEYLIEREEYSEKNKEGSVVIFCAAADESKVRGQKNKNSLKLASKYANLTIRIKPSPQIPKDSLGLAWGDAEIPKNLFTKQEFIGFQRI